MIAVNVASRSASAVAACVSRVLASGLDLQHAPRPARWGAGRAFSAPGGLGAVVLVLDARTSGPWYRCRATSRGPSGPMGMRDRLVAVRPDR